MFINGWWSKDLARASELEAPAAKLFLAQRTWFAPNIHELSLT
jgi:hypothetical protein